MKKITLLGLALVAALITIGCSGQSANSTKEIDLRIMCYNVHNCVGMDGEFSCERIAKIINDGNVEAVALQELDSMSKRHPVDVLGILSCSTALPLGAPLTLDCRDEGLLLLLYTPLIARRGPHNIGKHHRRGAF